MVRFAHRATIGILALAVFRLNAQSAKPAPDASLTFDVASIREHARPYPSGGGPWTVTHGQFRADTGWVRAVIAWSHGLLSAQVRGGPERIDTDRYDFNAKSEDRDAGPEQVKAMLRRLLTDRFKLVAHREMQDMQAYTLTIGKSGSKLLESEKRTKTYVSWTGPGQVEFTECNMLSLTLFVSAMLGSPVVDETGLNGTYSFKLEFTDPRRPQATSTSEGETRPSLVTAVRDQLGLKLEARKRPVEVLLIDRIERPSEN